MSRYAAGTAVASEHRRAEIERTLSRYGADGFAYACQGRTAMVEFLLGGRRIRFTLTLPDPLEAVDAGISTVDNEFLAAIVLPDGTTVGDRTVPALDAAYAGQPLPALMPGGGR